MILMHKIVQQSLIAPRADEEQPKPLLSLILFIIFLFSVPTAIWVMQMKAALNQPHNPTELETHTEMGEVF